VALFLTRPADAASQEMTVPDIIKKVFATTARRLQAGADQHVSQVDLLRAVPGDRLQLRSRLMEQEGSTTTSGTRRAQLDGVTDSCSKHVPSSGYEKIPFIAPTSSCGRSSSTSAAGSLARDPAWQVRAQDTTSSAERRSEDAEVIAYTCAEGAHEVFDYRGEYLQKADGEQLALVRIDDSGRSSRCQGPRTLRLTVGALFTLDDCRALIKREHLVIAASTTRVRRLRSARRRRLALQCSFGGHFHPAAVPPAACDAGSRSSRARKPPSSSARGRREIPHRPVRPGEGAVPLDRLGKKDENSSCWIRVSHPWAGKGWGAVQRHVWVKVIVDFLEGDPDQPIITGRVYNADQMPPLRAAGNKTQSASDAQLLGVFRTTAMKFASRTKKATSSCHPPEKNQTSRSRGRDALVGHDRKKTIDNARSCLSKHDRKETVDHDDNPD